MTDLTPEVPKRKLLSLKKERDLEPGIPRNPPRFFVNQDESVYMVWNAEGDMPKRVYGPHERSVATAHAMSLASQTGKRFFVMRAWRGYDPE